MITRRVALGMALALTTACAEKLEPDGAPDAGSRDAGPMIDGSIPPSSGAFQHEVGADGVVTTTVDATATDAWRYLDLETGLAVMPEDAWADPTWDLGFQRFYVITNGGVSGSAGGAAARLPGAPFESIDEAPETGWIVDAPDGEEDDDTGTDTAFNGGAGNVNDWYDYDVTSHRLTPRDVTFVVRSGQGGTFKVRMLGYYDSAGSPGVVRFHWARIGGGDVQLPDAGPPMRPDAGVPPDGGPDVVVPDDALTIDASSREEWVYVRLGAGVVEVADAASSDDWDLALQRAAIRTNSGSSGPGAGGARSAGIVELASVTETDTVGFAVDALEPSSSPGGEPSSINPVLGDWFDYDISTHVVTPKDVVWIVRTARGEYGRLRIWSWAGGVFQLSFDPIDGAPRAHTIEVDASASGEWAYVDLSDASVVSPADAPADAGWDLGLSRTMLRTNSGTSGPGAGGAIDTGEADPAAVIAIPADGWIADDERPVPGPPGSPTYSGNGALEGWYDYDPSTHAVTPRATTFLVRLADGSAGRMRITGWTGGRFTLEWTYAGPRRSSL